MTFSKLAKEHDEFGVAETSKSNNKINNKHYNKRLEQGISLQGKVHFEVWTTRFPY